MNLQTLTLSNFMPFKGEQKIAFPVLGSRNVTLIYGDNMRGKTSLLNAIRWVLYGKVYGRHLRPIPAIYILNKDAAYERDFVVKVALSFTHQAIEYEIVRTMRPKDLIDSPREQDHFDVLCSLRRAGTPIAANQIESEINQVLPESISRFSLFDGELLQEYEQLVSDATTASDRIKEAIESALGVPALINGRTDIYELLQRAQRAFARDQDKDSQHSKLIKQTFDELEAENLELARLRELLAGATSERDGLEDELKRFERAESIKTKIEENRRALMAAEAAHGRALHRLRELAPDAWLALIASSIATKKDEVEAQLIATQSRLEDAVKHRVERGQRVASLQSGICALCSQPLMAAAVQDLTNREGLAGPEHDLATLSAELGLLRRQFEKLRRLGGSTMGNDLIHTQGEFDRTSVEITKLKLHEERLVNEIPGIDLTELAHKRERKDGLQREIGRLEAQVSVQQQKCIGLQKKYDSLIKAAASGQQGFAQLIGRKVTLLSALSDIFRESIDRLRLKLSKKVEEAATSTFKRLTTERQYSGLAINDRYGLEIRDHLNRTVSVRSAGAEQIVALSLIDGLNHASGSSGLLVMDTPFGRLDLKHRAQVLSYLPSMATQVILLVHEGELSRDRDLAVLGERVAEAYEIERVSPTQSILARK
jgi:DNA sulfur modification protein DndD